ncbi:MAG: RluA family pseudouridine synthase [Cytophagales bacterium]|nr:RluA family pseudouridine synthase [Bernardetiaceae bacterium]MDW8203678.1 RluA family pseudouridine synthase [Cytophagales bacterium]
MMHLHAFSVVYEDNHLLVVNKQSGIPSQSDLTGDPALTDYVKNYLKEKYNKPGNIFCGLVHRLDRPVSGLMVLAKTSKALTRMNEIFRSRQVQKTYLAVSHCQPQPTGGKLIHWLTKNAKTNVTRAHLQEVKNSDRAELDYRLVATWGDKSLLEVHPITGRGHQIRVQLASIGCPIWGDVKYGSTVKDSTGCIGLHAYQISFEHPVQKRMVTFSAEPPFERPVWKVFQSIIG